MVTGKFKKDGFDYFITGCLCSKCDGGVIVPYKFEIQKSKCEICNTPYKIRIYKRGTVSIQRTDV
jgi:hypothetical protein